jgi:hypothetical protein
MSITTAVITTQTFSLMVFSGFITMFNIISINAWKNHNLPNTKLLMYQLISLILSMTSLMQSLLLLLFVNSNLTTKVNDTIKIIWYVNAWFSYFGTLFYLISLFTSIYHLYLNDTNVNDSFNISTIKKTCMSFMMIFLLINFVFVIFEIVFINY